MKLYLSNTTVRQLPAGNCLPWFYYIYFRSLVILMPAGSWRTVLKAIFQPERHSRVYGNPERLAILLKFTAQIATWIPVYTGMTVRFVLDTILTRTSTQPARHSREGGNPGRLASLHNDVVQNPTWIPVYTGMTDPWQGDRS